MIIYHSRSLKHDFSKEKFLAPIFNTNIKKNISPSCRDRLQIDIMYWTYDRLFGHDLTNELCEEN